MADEPAAQADRSADLAMTAEIVSAYLRNNVLPAAQVPDIIRSVYETLNSLDTTQVTEEQEQQKPAVPVRRSVRPDYIICLEDGKKLKMLKRYLRTTYDMTPEQYRAKWDLPPDYPMVAPNYAAQRSEFAKKIGLGKSRTTAKRGRGKAKT
ncbi:MAG: MucR family transcriptional regulator [Alphaproteobacteria bacterium]